MERSCVRVVAAAITCLGLTGCTPESPGVVRGVFSDTLGLGAVSNVAPCTDCIVEQRIATLGDTTEQATILDSWLRVVVDTSGRYWVSQPSELKVFAPSGTLERRVGRAGAGPMEFRRPIPIHASTEGRVHVLDANQRETTVDMEFNRADERLFPGFPSDVAALSDGRFAASMWIPTSQSLALPLHLVDDGVVVRSFGVVDADTGLMSGFSSGRVLTIDARDRIFASRQYELLVEAWDTTGRRLGGLRGEPLNTEPVSPGAWTDANPPANRIWALRVDSLERLWVVSWRRRPAWRSLMKEVLASNGQMRLEMKEAGAPSQDLFTCMIEVVDLRELRLLARQASPHMLQAFVGGVDAIVGQEFDSEGTMRIGVWQLSLKP